MSTWESLAADLWLKFAKVDISRKWIEHIEKMVPDDTDVSFAYIFTSFAYSFTISFGGLVASLLYRFIFFIHTIAVQKPQKWCKIGLTCWVFKKCKTIHQKSIKLEPKRSDQCSDIDIMRAVDFHIATELLKGHAIENRHKLIVYIVELRIGADWELVHVFIIFKNMKTICWNGSLAMGKLMINVF